MASVPDEWWQRNKASLNHEPDGLVMGIAHHADFAQVDKARHSQLVAAQFEMLGVDWPQDLLERDWPPKRYQQALVLAQYLDRFSHMEQSQADVDAIVAEMRNHLGVEQEADEYVAWRNWHPKN